MPEGSRIKAIHIFDIEPTLYTACTEQPPYLTPESWRFSARSLGLPNPPGFDVRWNLDLLLRFRKLSLTGEDYLFVLSTRPDHAEMRKVWENLVYLAALPHVDVQLKPAWPHTSTAVYVAEEVTRRVLSNPSVERIFVYDAEPEVSAVIQRVGAQAQRRVQLVETRSTKAA